MSTIQTKCLSIRKFGWKRVCSCHARFGWELDEAIERTKTKTTTEYEGRIEGDRVTLKPNTTTTTDTRILLTFTRDRSRISNYLIVWMIELLYNVAFLFRRLIGFFMPFTVLAFSVVFLMGDSGSEIGQMLTGVLGVHFLVWLTGVVLEVIISAIGGAVIRYK